MSLTSICIVLFASFMTSAIATAIAIPLLMRTGSMDIPNHRSSHTTPTPRGGGLGIILGLTVGLLVAQYLGAGLVDVKVLVAALMVALIGFADDQLRGVSIVFRLAVQVSAAFMVAAGSGGLTRFPLPAPLDFELGVLAIPVAVFWIVAVTNIFNFLDGVDGFAGLQTLIAGLAIALWTDNEAISALGFAIASASAGFLLFNWHPARVFMGDVGAPAIGFLFAALTLQFPEPMQHHAVFAMCIFLWFFLSDATFTMIVRMKRREAIWKPHRSHVYQRLVQSGLTHDYVVLRVMGAGAVLAAITVAVGPMPEPMIQWGIAAISVAAFCVYLAWIIYRENAGWKHSDSAERIDPYSESRSSDLQPNAE